MTDQRLITDIRGAMSIAFALAALTMPRDTFAELAIVWGLYAFCDGILGTVTGVITRSSPALSAGLALIAAGICAFLQPELTGLDLMPVIAAWALLRGLFDFSIASIPGHKSLLIANGVVSVCFAPLLLTVQNQNTALYTLGSYAAITGVILLGSSPKGDADRAAGEGRDGERRQEQNGLVRHRRAH